MLEPHIAARWFRFVCLAGALGVTAVSLQGQTGRFSAETAQIMKADADFAQSVAQRNRERFASFIAESTTFNGGSPNELRGRDAVVRDWSDFFDPNGPTLSWTPTHGEVVGAGDLGFTTGTSIFRAKGPNGLPTERRGEYLTVWRKQRDGSWKVVFDTGSTLPATAVK